MDQGLNTVVPNAAFRQLLAGIEHASGEPVRLSAPRVFELLMPGDLPVRVTVHPDDEHVVVDVYLYNAVTLTGALRSNLLQACLLLNHAATRGRRFAIALDNRDFVLLTATLPLADGTADSFHEDLAYLAGQGARVRELIEDVTLARAEAPVKLSSAPDAAVTGRLP